MVSTDDILFNLEVRGTYSFIRFEETQNSTIYIMRDRWIFQRLQTSHNSYFLFGLFFPTKTHESIMPGDFRTWQNRQWQSGGPQTP